MNFPKFTDELYEKSKAIHAKSDRLVQLKLAVALTDLKLYQQVLCDFHCIFKAIEQGISKNLSHKFVGVLWKKELERTSLIEKDLDYYAGLGWKTAMHPSDVALEYASHIENIAFTEPELLTAYIHTMYLAVFSGGHVIRGIIRRTLGISGPEGLEMFDVPDGFTRQEIKKHIKGTIDEMDIDRDTKDKIVQEKIKIFERNNLIVANVQPAFSSFNRIIKFLAAFILVIFCFYLFVVNIKL